jgi:hypothetical protein
LPISNWEIPRPKFSDEKIHIPRPPQLHISAKHHRWMECRNCGMPQVQVDMRWAGKGMRIVKCNWCHIQHKIRITNFGHIKWEGVFQ